MALAVQTQVSDGSLKTIQVGIDFFAQSDVQVYLDLTGDALVAGTDYAWTASKTITFPTAVPAGSTVFLIRQTQVDEMLNIFDGGAGFTRYTLDENFRQILLLAQEVREGVGLRGVFLPLDMHGYPIKNLGPAVADTDAASLAAVKTVAAQVTAGYQAGDANLQAQLTGNVPLLASAFSEISWHGKTIQNSVTIPPNKNAWSFGPQMSIAEGQSVTIPEGSAWTIADGDEQDGSIDLSQYSKKADLAATSGAGLVGFTQPGSGVQRTVAQELVGRAATPQQFGGTGNAAIQAAGASGKPVYFPAGTYVVTDTLAFTTAQTWVTDGKVTIIADFPAGSSAKPVLDFRAKVFSIGEFIIDHQANTKGYTVPTGYNGNPISGSAVLVQGDESYINGWRIINAWDNGLAAVRIDPSSGLETAGSPKYGTFSAIITRECGVGVHGGLTPGKIGAGIDIGSASVWTVDDCKDYMSYIGFILDVGAGAQCSFNNCHAFYTKLDTANPTNGSGYGFYAGSSESLFTNCSSIGSAFRGFWLDAVGNDFVNCLVYIPQKEGVFIKKGQMRAEFRIKGAGFAQASLYDAVLIDSSAGAIDSLLLNLQTTGTNHRYGVNATGGNTIDARVTGYVTGSVAKVNRQSYNIGTAMMDPSVGAGKKFGWNKDTPGMEFDIAGRFRVTADRANLSSTAAGSAFGDASGNGTRFVEDFVTNGKRMADGWDPVNNAFVAQSMYAGVSKMPYWINPAGGEVMVGTGLWNEPVRLGANRLWFDATGKLRTKASAPTGDTDGVVVGTQA